MSDESFFREVNEDLRSERLRRFWNRFGWMIVTAVVIIILATAGWVGYSYWQDQRAARSGDAFLQALTLARDGETDEAMAVLAELEETGVGAYPVLARMRAATLSAEAGNFADAIDAFTVIGNDGSVPRALREVARIRAAYLLVDHGSYEDVLATVDDMTEEGHPMRHSAREALGMAAWKAGHTETAEGWFEQIASDPQAGGAFAERADIMLDLIEGGASAGETLPDASPETAGDETEAPVSPDTRAPALAPADGNEEDPPETTSAPPAEPGASGPRAEPESGVATPPAGGRKDAADREPQEPAEMPSQENPS